MATFRAMTQERAESIVARRFGETLEVPTVPRALPGTVVDPDGRTWLALCRCPMHPNRGHPARPVIRDAATDGSVVRREDGR